MNFEDLTPKSNHIAWLTDIHLDFLSNNEIIIFFESILKEKVDAVMISGDIAAASTIERFLLKMEKYLQIPIFFVLGNHDFYSGSIENTRQTVERVAEDSEYLYYLSSNWLIDITSSVALIGHDGWADGRYGDYAHSSVLLNDYILIHELAGLDKSPRLKLMQKLAKQTAAYLTKMLPEAFEKKQELLLLTHVPPFKESCWHQGNISAPIWLPHFSSKVVGDTLLKIMKARPEKMLTVLCGHTHSSGEAELLPNLKVFTGKAEYGRPEIQKIFAF